MKLDLFADGLDREPYVPTAFDGVDVFHADHLESMDHLRGGYDRVVYALGNSDNHLAALRSLRRRPGVVIAHDVRMSNVYRFGAKDPAAVPDGFAGSIRRIYRGQLPHWLGAGGSLADDEQERYGVLMLREIVELAERVLFSSREAMKMAELEAGAGAAGKLAVLTFAAEPPALGAGGFDSAGDAGGAIPQTEHLVVTLGIVHPIRKPLQLIEVFAEVVERLPDAHLGVVGPVPPELNDALRKRAAELGIAGSVTVTGQVATTEFLAWMSRAALAVQLRASWNGEAASTVGECIASGLPVVVSDLGWMRELPDDVVAKAGPDETLATLIGDLLLDGDRRQAMREAGLRFAETMSFEAAAAELLKYLEEGTDWAEIYPSDPRRTSRNTRRAGSRSAGRS